MKFIAAASALVLSASPVLAHAGAHVHPHGSESLLAYGLGVIALAGAALFYTR